MCLVITFLAVRMPTRAFAAPVHGPASPIGFVWSQTPTPTLSNHLLALHCEAHAQTPTGTPLRVEASVLVRVSPAESYGLLAQRSQTIKMIRNLGSLRQWQLVLSV